ncbi:hypothetical protein N7457_006157, partial [Penicillium paradoxum]|uniref:uncharacterized protein n=1 Tax=Penicillium paradoxum TaxID=176176 RepID=UPI002547A28C
TLSRLPILPPRTPWKKLYPIDSTKSHEIGISDCRVPSNPEQQDGLWLPELPHPEKTLHDSRNGYHRSLWLPLILRQIPKTADDRQCQCPLYSSSDQMHPGFSAITFLGGMKEYST